MFVWQQTESLFSGVVPFGPHIFPKDAWRKIRKGWSDIIKKWLTYLLLFAALLCLCACGSKAKIEGDDSSVEEQHGKSEKIDLSQIAEQLQGSWKSTDSDNVYTIWTFYDGSYVADTYVNGKKIPNSTIGTYAIGVDSIHTVTVDQEKNVEGSIRYTFTDGVLTLNGANGDLIKEK